MNDEHISDKKFYQSYLYSDFGNFFISTIYRQSSSIYGGMFYETFAWKLDEKGERTDFVADNSGALSKNKALEQHMEIVRQLNETGEYKEIEK